MSTSESTAGSAPRGIATLLRAADAVDSVGWIAVLRVALGALYVSVFFDNLAKHLYGASGYAGLIREYAAQNNAPGFWSDGVMKFIADQASVFAPLQGVFELTLAVLLVLGIATGPVALLAAGQLAGLWLSELGIFWVWELLLLVIIATVVGLSALPRLLDRRLTLSERLLGEVGRSRLLLPGRAGIALLGGAALALVSLGARTGGHAHFHAVAAKSGALFAALLLAMGLLDHRRGAARR